MTGCLILFKEGSIIEEGLDIISGRFLKGDLFTSKRVGAYLAFKQEKYSLAARLFRNAAARCQQEEDGQYLTCMAELSRYLAAGVSRENALSALAFLFGETLRDKAAYETDDPKTIMGKVFPKLQCFDCDSCPLAGIHCEYPEASEIIRKLNRALSGSTVSQESLLQKLRELTDPERKRS